MRIGNGYQGIMQLFSRMNGNKMNINMPFGARASTRRSGAVASKKHEDSKSGTIKN